MTAAVAEMKADKYRLTDRGLIVTEALSYDEWKSLGARVARHASGVQWAVGDWLLAVPRKETWRETLEFASEFVPFDWPALMGHRRTAEAFTHDERTLPLPWSFYAATLPLDPIDRLPALERVVSDGITLTKFVEWVRTSRLGGLPVVDRVQPVEKRSRKEGQPPFRSRGLVCCPHCEQSFYVQIRKSQVDGVLVSLDRQATEADASDV